MNHTALPLMAIAGVSIIAAAIAFGLNGLAVIPGALLCAYSIPKVLTEKKKNTRLFIDTLRDFHSNADGIFTGFLCGITFAAVTVLIIAIV